MSTATDDYDYDYERLAAQVEHYGRLVADAVSCGLRDLAARRRRALRQLRQRLEALDGKAAGRGGRR
jgi:hypothetical protein